MAAIEHYNGEDTFTTLTGETITLSWSAVKDYDGFWFSFYTLDEDGYSDEEVDLEALCGARQYEDFYYYIADKVRY